MPKLNIMVLGITEVQKSLALKNNKILNNVKEAIAQSGVFIESEVVESIAGRRDEVRSVDTGNFMQGIKLNTKDNGFTAEIISTNADEYAPILEYGSSTREPRLHFGNTADRNREKIRTFLQDAVKNATK